jgi:Domain of unknown function (DUF5753)
VPKDQAEDLAQVNREAHRAVHRIRGGADIQPHQRRAADLIRAAHAINYYSPEVFPGMLQHEGYARATMAPDGHVTDVLETRLRFRLDLGEVLTRSAAPLRLWAVVGEAALRKNVGGTAVMREQLRHVVELCRSLPKLTVQVLPLTTREHFFTGATVSIYSFDGTIPPIASVDTTIGKYCFERDAAVAEAIGKFDDVRTKAIDPLTSLDMMEDAAASR